MKVDLELSRKLTVMSVGAMVAVVFIHSTAYLTLAHPARWNVFAETIVTRSFSRWAVPFFFALSGFWFGRSGYLRGEGTLGALLRKKVRTLLVPYLCWCVLGFLIATPLVVGNNFLTGRVLVERTVLAVPGVLAKIDAFVGFSSVGPKTNMPLWYVRSLILLFLMAPLSKCLMARKISRILLVAFAIWEVCFENVLPGVLCLPGSAFGWFVIGIELAQHAVEKWRVGSGLFVGSFSLYVAASVMLALVIAGYVPGCKFLAADLDNAIIPLFGIIFYWGLYDRIPWLKTCTIPWAMRQTFFIYCIQEMICGYFLSSARFLLGKTDIATFLLTLVVPWLVCATCMGLAMGLKRFAPRFYDVITGGRG